MGLSAKPGDAASRAAASRPAGVSDQLKWTEDRLATCSTRPARSGLFTAAQALGVDVERFFQGLKDVFLQVNDWVGEEAVRFADYLPPTSAEPATPAGGTHAR